MKADRMNQRRESKQIRNYLAKQNKTELWKAYSTENRKYR